MLGFFTNFKHRVGFFMLAALMTALTVSCASSDVRPTMKVSQTFTVQLKGNPTTGYQWTCLETTPELLCVESRFVPDDKTGTLVGSGGTFRFTLKAVKKGIGTAKFAYRRPWEKTVSPLKTETVKIDIR